MVSFSAESLTHHLMSELLRNVHLKRCHKLVLYGGTLKTAQYGCPKAENSNPVGVFFYSEFPFLLHLF